MCVAIASAHAQGSLRIIHVFVALADNQHQGIVPVPAHLGNGEDPEHNLYWGSAYGVKTYFSRSADWVRITCKQKSKAAVLERCLFRHRSANVYLVADAYRGVEIRQAVADFLNAAWGGGGELLTVPNTPDLSIYGGANLVAYVGHDGLMDFQLSDLPQQKNQTHRDAVILACASKQFFAGPVRASGAYPLLWTTGLMAPEAYTLKSALDGWIEGQSNEQIRDLAAGAYDKYQKCGVRAARRLLVSGW